MWECNKTSKRTHQLLVGSPCLHCCSTKPSWPQTNPPSNWQNQHCNHTAWTTSRSHRPGSGNPCRGLCSTTPSWALTSLLANWRNHRHSCKDRRVAPARWAQELARRSAAAVRLKGNRRGECGSTTPSYRLATCSRDQPRS